MDLERLRYLAAVARTGSVRAAATALSVSPGAVSKGITKLEEETGDQLVRPRGRGIELTDSGRWLAQRAAYLLDEHASIAADLRSRRASTSSFCTATYDVFASWLAPLVARQYLPDVPLTLRERWPGEVEAAVSSRLSDAGVTYIPVPTQGVSHEEVARVDMGVFTVQRAFRDVDTIDLPFAVPFHPVSGSVGQYGPLDGWPADAPQRTIVFASSSLESRLELCREGGCALVLPAFVAAHHNQRVRAAQRLEPRSHRLIGARWQRRVYVVRRTGASPELERRTDSLVAAVTAFCSH